MDRVGQRTQGHPRWVVTGMVALALGFWAAVGTTVLYANEVLAGVPDRRTLGRVTEMARGSILYDHRGRPAFTISKEQRIEVPLDRMSPTLRQAILAIEDQRFYDHQGVDLIRIAGAAIANVRDGRRGQGASTITQQLARLSFLTTDKTYTRKIQEAILAALIEREYTKDQILELYLNKVYFGSGFYGAEAAALGYFGKHASELSVPEAALLAGLVKAPSSYAPKVALDKAIRRQGVVLQAMRDMGAIDEAALAAARESGLAFHDALNQEEPYGRFFKEYVRRELVARFGEERVYEGGLQVFTTIDIEMQRAADAEVQRALADLDRRRGRRARQSPDLLQASLIAIDPQSGQVRALIGGRDFIQSNYNRAVLAERQPGSAFKPFVYAAALEAGYTAASLIEHLDEPIQTVQGAYVPEDGHSTASALTIRAALKTSSNRAAVRLIEELGVQKAVAYAARAGMPDMPRVPSLALGSGEVTLEALTAAYGAFASAGVRRQPIYITHVEDADGQRLYTAPDEWEQVVSEETAFLMTDMLSDVIDHGTAWKARQLGFRLPAAGKTGTTNDYRDAWFVGYTPRLVTGVWIGFDQPQPIMPRGYAADVAVPLWAGFMKQATAGDPAAWYRPPRGVIGVDVCRLSGKRPADGCSRATWVTDAGDTREGSTVYTEYFVSGTEPDDSCAIHADRSIFGRVAEWFGAPPSAPAPHRPSIDRAGDPAADAVPAAATPTESHAQAADPPRKKRSFWSRVFGRRGGQ